MEFLQTLRLAHLQLLMNTSAKYQANWTETVGVFRTRFCGQTDRKADSSIPPTNFVCGDIKKMFVKHNAPAKISSHQI